MAADTQARINLTALKRRDPYIANILDSATHVAVYTFNPTSGEWEKTDIEGTLFVYSRLAPPMAGFTIMNQLSMDNLTEALTSSHEFQNQSPFLLYRNAKMQIYGIWFYDMYDCSRIGNLLVQICSNKFDLSATKPANEALQPNSPVSSSSSSALSLLDGNIEEDVTLTSASVDAATSNNSANSVDIMQILNKAKKEYDKTGTVVNAPKKNEVRKLHNKISKAELFKPVTTESDTKKVNVASLFEQSDLKKELKIKRPSSTNAGDMIEKRILPKTQSHPKVAESHRRYGSRSMSLSLSNEQNNLPNVVNGAISVEELESPVMGMPARRARCSSVNENNQHTTNMRGLGFLATSENNGPLHKLLNKADNSKGSDLASAAHANSSIRNVPDERKSFASTYPTAKGEQFNFHLMRSASIPVSRPNTDLTSAVSNSFQPHIPPTSSSSSLSSLMSVFPSTMPTLHEHVSPRTGLMKSVSLTSGVSQALHTSTVKNPSLQNAATLHGTASRDKEPANLLSPTALLPKSTSQNISALASTFTNLSTTTTSTQNASAESSQASGDPKTLISPEDFEHSSTTPQKAMQLHKRLLPTTQRESIEPLDKSQLASVLIHLLQTDSSFVDVIHTAYINGMNASDNHEKSTLKDNLSMWK